MCTIKLMTLLPVNDLPVGLPTTRSMLSMSLLLSSVKCRRRVMFDYASWLITMLHISKHFNEYFYLKQVCFALLR